MTESKCNEDCRGIERAKILKSCSENGGEPDGIKKKAYIAKNFYCGPAGHSQTQCIGFLALNDLATTGKTQIKFQ